MPTAWKLRALWAELSRELRHAVVVATTVAVSAIAAITALTPFLRGLNVPGNDLAILTSIVTVLSGWVSWVHAHGLTEPAQPHSPTSTTSVGTTSLTYIATSCIPSPWRWHRSHRRHRKPKPPTPTPTPTPTPPAPPAPPAPAAKTIVAWINEAKQSLTQLDAARIVEALNLQVPHLEAAWPNVSIEHVLVDDVAHVPAGAERAYWLPDADVAGALGYHDVDPTGAPYTRVFTDTILQNSGAVLTGAVSIAVCSSHEACEMAVDPSCQATATAPNGDVWALEVGDPVESDFYNVTLADGTIVALSDFVCPAFFGRGSGALDQTGNATATFTLAPGGYAIVNGGQVFADGYPEWRKATKVFPAARTARRLAR